MLEILQSGGQSEEQARLIRVQLGIESADDEIHAQFGTIATTSKPGRSSTTQQKPSHSPSSVSSTIPTHRPGSKVVLLHWNPKQYPSIYSANSLEQHLYVYGEVESILFGRDGRSNNGSASVEFRTAEGAEACFDGIKQRKEKEIRQYQSNTQSALSTSGIMDVEWPPVFFLFFSPFFLPSLYSSIIIHHPTYLFLQEDRVSSEIPASSQSASTRQSQRTRSDPLYNPDEEFVFHRFLANFCFFCLIPSLFISIYLFCLWISLINDHIIFHLYPIAKSFWICSV